MRIIFKLLFILFISVSSSYSQNKIIDSLITLLKKNKSDTSKIINLNKLAWEYKNFGSYDSAIQAANTALHLAEKLNLKKEIASSYNNIRSVLYNRGNYPQALEYGLKALKISEDLKDKDGMTKSLGNIGMIYFNKGNYPKAMEYYLKSLRIAEEQGNKIAIVNNLGNIGLFYKEIGDYVKSLDFNLRTLKLAEELGNKSLQAKTLNNIGDVYLAQSDYSKSLEYYFKGLKMSEEIGVKRGIAIVLNNIGEVYLEEGSYPKALDYFLRALKLHEELGNKSLIAKCLGSIGSLYIKSGNFSKADEYLKKAVAIDENIGELNDLRQFDEMLSKIYDTTGLQAENRGQYEIAAKNLNLSMYYLKKATNLKDTLFSQENKKQLVRNEMNYEFDKKEAATKAIHDKQLAVADTENKKQKIIIWVIIVGLILIIMLSFFMFNRWRITKNQKNIIEDQKEKIIDSITYAQRIQQSILMDESEIQFFLPDSFIFYQPKDIVSGDFYWFSSPSPSLSKGEGAAPTQAMWQGDGAVVNSPPLGESEGASIIIAAIDCTGHGVPGAFMSMIGNTLLNQIVNEKKVTIPSEILRLLNIGVYKALHQEKNDALSRDGMDISLCCIDYKNKILQFAGAQNPLYVISDNELTVIKGNKQGIGGGGSISKIIDPNNITFTNHAIPIKKNMSIYLFSDGYMDQFGLPPKTSEVAQAYTESREKQRIKFGMQKFQEILLNDQHLNMQQQKELIVSAHNDWKGETQQLDDILVIGVRL